MKPHSPAVCEISILTYSVRIAAPSCTPWRAAKRVCRPRVSWPIIHWRPSAATESGWDREVPTLRRNEMGDVGDTHNRPPAPRDRDRARTARTSRPLRRASPGQARQTQPFLATVPNARPTLAAQRRSGHRADSSVAPADPRRAAVRLTQQHPRFPQFLCATRASKHPTGTGLSFSVHNRSGWPGDRRPILRSPLRQQSSACPSLELQDTLRSSYNWNRYNWNSLLLALGGRP